MNDKPVIATNRAKRSDMNNLITKTFEGHTIRAYLDESGNPWFVAADVCAAIDLGNVTQSIKRLDDDEQALISNEGIHRGAGQVNVINESGLYSLILGSRKPEAKLFKKWVTNEVLPSIRKTGAFGVAHGKKKRMLLGFEKMLLQDAIQSHRQMNDKSLDTAITRRLHKDVRLLTGTTRAKEPLMVENFDEVSRILKMIHIGAPIYREKLPRLQRRRVADAVGVVTPEPQPKPVVSVPEQSPRLRAVDPNGYLVMSLFKTEISIPKGFYTPTQVHDRLIAWSGGRFTIAACSFGGVAHNLKMKDRQGYWDKHVHEFKTPDPNRPGIENTSWSYSETAVAEILKVAEARNLLRVPREKVEPEQKIQPQIGLFDQSADKRRMRN
jgi:prophage antirepressor-like protein